MTDNIIYTDNLKNSSEFLRLAIALLAKHQIPVDPHNYQIAYEYVSGKNVAVEEDLNQLLAKFEVPSEKQLRSLYKSHFVQDETSLEIMRQEIRLIISNVLQEFNYSDKKLSNYSQTLNSFINILDVHDSPDKLLGETRKIISETHTMEKAQHHSEDQLAIVMADIDLLRRELDQVKEESKIDALTGIANRKSFDTALEQSIQSARENNKTFCLLILDIDLFKAFNDNHGHLIGDKVLRYVAKTFKRNIKGNDLVARFGGEEFMIILPETQMSGALAVAEQIREAISSGNLTEKKSDTSYGKITISIGVTQFRASDISDDLIKRADKALYHAKERGRNRVEKL